MSIWKTIHHQCPSWIQAKYRPTFRTLSPSRNSWKIAHSEEHYQMSFRCSQASKTKNMLYRWQIPVSRVAAKKRQKDYTNTTHHRYYHNVYHGKNTTFCSPSLSTYLQQLVSSIHLSRRIPSATLLPEALQSKNETTRKKQTLPFRRYFRFMCIREKGGNKGGEVTVPFFDSSGCSLFFSSVKINTIKYPELSSPHTQQLRWCPLGERASSDVLPMQSSLPAFFKDTPPPP